MAEQTRSDPLTVRLKSEVVMAVTNGRLDCGTWERIFYGEFDGRRQKRVTGY